MVGTNFRPSFDMFMNLTKEDILNAPSIPVEKIKKRCASLDKALAARRKKMVISRESN